MDTDKSKHEPALAPSSARAVAAAVYRASASRAPAGGGGVGAAAAVAAAAALSRNARRAYELNSRATSASRTGMAAKCAETAARSSCLESAFTVRLKCFL